MTTEIKHMKDGDEFVGYYLIKEVEAKLTNTANPKDFLDLVLADSTGQVSAKFWDASKTDIETFVPMSLVKVQGVVQTYRDKLQVKIIRLRLATEEDGVSLTDFIRSAPVDSKELIAYITDTIGAIKHEEMKRIVSYCFGKVKDRMPSSPAAKSFHHAYYGGLAYHVARMLELGDFLCRQRPFLNEDLLKAGIILHDIAKPEEMISEYGMVSDYSNHGKLIGHISMVSNWIAEAAVKLDIDPGAPVVTALQHMVLSHHNLGEWGSPVQPQLPEAVALHHIDGLDAKLQMAEDALQSMPPDQEWTPPIRGLENKAVFRLKL